MTKKIIFISLQNVLNCDIIFKIKVKKNELCLFSVYKLHIHEYNFNSEVASYETIWFTEKARAL